MWYNMHMKTIKSLDNFDYDNEKLYCTWAVNEIYESLAKMNATSCADADVKIRMDAFAEFHRVLSKKVKLKMDAEITFSDFSTVYDYYKDNNKVQLVWSKHKADILYDDVAIDNIEIMVYFSRIHDTKRFYFNDFVVSGGLGGINEYNRYRRYVYASRKFQYEGSVDSNGRKNLLFSNHVARKIDDYIRAKKKRARDIILKRENDRLESIKMKKFIDNVF